MSLRNILGLAAAAALVVGVPALAATPASAAPVSASDSPDYDYDAYWGSYYSKNYLAKAKGWIDVNYDDDESNSVHITGKLYDLDHRTYHEGGKCAYVKFRYQSWDHDEDHWASNTKSYKYCGAGGYKVFNFWRHDVAQVQVKVCQIGLHSNYPTKCGYWKELYNAYEGHYGYEA